MNRKLTAQLAVLILLSLLTACSSASGPPSEPVTVTFVVVTLPWLSSQLADYERLAETFHEANPPINVLVKFVSVEELPEGLANADFLTDPEWGVDVVMTSADLFPGLAQHGLLRDLQPSLEADQALQSEDFYLQVLDALRWQGRVYGLPTELDPWVVFYNRDLFDAADLPYPSGDWHWSNFLETARALAGNLGPGHFAFGSWGAQVTPCRPALG